MAHNIVMGQRIVGTMSADGKVNYDGDHVQSVIREIVAGRENQGGKSGGSFFTNVRVIYKWDQNRKDNNDAVYKMWKNNPIIQNRVRQLNALTFGRGFMYSYDDATKETIDRCWRLNRLRQKLNAMGTDSQLYGEVFIGLFPQQTGDVLIAVYESGQVDIDFNPANVDDINEYIVVYKNPETDKDEQLRFQPVYKYLNEIEYLNPVQKTVKKIKRNISGKSMISGFDGVMIHLKFNNSSSEVHGTSDFRQIFNITNEYMDFRSDRLAIHQLYGSPMFDIEIDTEDPSVIMDRIEELAGFTIGSNPVHNKNEKWTPLEFKNSADSAEFDEKGMRGLICAGTGFPEYLLFNQGDGDKSGNGTFALNKLAEDRQDAFGDAFADMHKFILAIAGQDITAVDEGQIIFPEISTMSEKVKAETYVLKVGAGICSRETASYNTGHNWEIEEKRIMEEREQFGMDSDFAGMIGGRFSSRINNQDPDRDDGSEDRMERMKGANIKSQVMGEGVQNN